MSFATDLLPDHKEIDSSDIAADVGAVLQENRSEVKNILRNTKDQVSWDDLVAPIEAMEDRISKLWSPISQLNSVVNTEKLRSAHDACVPLLSEYQTELHQSTALFERFRSIRDSQHFSMLDVAQQKIVTDNLREFQRNGVSLPYDQRKRFKELSKRLSELSSTFGNNVLDATDAWSKHVALESEVAGMPEANLAIARNLAEEKGLEGYVLTLDMPCYINVMLHCTDRELRKEMWEASASRASDVGPHAGKFDNGHLIKEILEIRHELSNLVGFETFAEFSIDEKMVTNAKQALEFLEDLLNKAIGQARTEFEELKKFAKESYGLDSLELWDEQFMAERMRERLFDIKDEQLKPYFPLEKVLEGMFDVVSSLFGVEIRGIEPVGSWHSDVRMFEIWNSEERIAVFYLDPFARPKKQSGAWMADCRSRRAIDDHLQLPVAYLTCNFTPPVDGKPSLLDHNEVITLFHEFGHGLHHMLTKQTFIGVSGINGVEWDAVELPSQFMENWCWQPDCIAKISAHYETNEPLPNELIEKLLAAKNFRSATKMVRQLRFGLFDLSIHMSKPEQVDPLRVWREIGAKTHFWPVSDIDRWPCSFGHIFAGGYAAGYYSYLWAEVLSADAFAAFEEEGLANKATGQRFLKCILEAGGSQPAAHLFRKFRGRDPEIGALLRHSGI